MPGNFVSNIIEDSEGNILVGISSFWGSVGGFV